MDFIYVNFFLIFGLINLCLFIILAFLPRIILPKLYKKYKRIFDLVTTIVLVLLTFSILFFITGIIYNLIFVSDISRLG